MFKEAGRNNPYFQDRIPDRPRRRRLRARGGAHPRRSGPGQCGRQPPSQRGKAVGRLLPRRRQRREAGQVLRRQALRAASPAGAGQPLEQHITAVRQVVAEGVPLNGHLVWSRLDSFEWSWGFSRRFGIVYVTGPERASPWVRHRRWAVVGCGRGRRWRPTFGCGRGSAGLVDAGTR
jgi:hypothetical protein